MFNTGDVVRLKSGGAYMTVAEADGTAANCIWHDVDGRLQTATLSNSVLEKVTGSDFNKSIGYTSKGYA